MLDKVSGTETDAVPATDTVPSAFSAQDVKSPAAHEKTESRAGVIVKRSALIIIQSVLMIGVLAGAFVMTKAMLADKPEPSQRRAFKPVYTVETVVAQAMNVQPNFIAYGQTVAARTIDLRSLVSGEVVAISPKLEAGARVDAGDALVTIDAFEFEGALQEARSNLAEAQARIAENEAQIALEQSKLSAAEEQLKFALDDVARAEQLRQRGTSTQQQLDARRLVQSQREQQLALARDTIAVQEARLEQLRASLARLEWRVAQAQRNVESTVLKAPFAGVVRTSSAQVGRNVTANDVVVSLYEEDALDAKFTLTDAQYGRLQTDEVGLNNRTVDVTWTVGGKGYTWPATIDRLGADIASARGGVEVFASIGDADHRVTLRPGAFVEVKVPDRTFEGAFIIPDQAVYGRDTVYIAVEGVLEERTVEIAAFEGENAIVTAGLKPGDEVLITRITEVSAGLNVRKEGDVDPPRGQDRPESGEGRPTASIDTPQGRPSPEEVAAIVKANDMTRDDFRALPPPERRAMIAKYRASDKVEN
ncbi:efflux RND transporter periplasmic adaptor subunit [Ahrensia sp. R2A130]|uniref:efflux RND transporter periplasmic adaptor subunit n=1 Tax=Ahrensia sp. R2A130 TaxID=744979 RepID=UPI0001E0F0C6|nr:efflux RND transporter periplasmic adaptor subunit [Ahrensia sp. R2A130]EFL89179.1 putative RND family efflux transporter MFP subunit [Ahrensia sp. R2A130]